MLPNQNNHTSGPTTLNTENMSFDDTLQNNTTDERENETVANSLAQVASLSDELPPAASDSQAEQDSDEFQSANGAPDRDDDEQEETHSSDPADDDELRAILEALVFASDEPLTFKQIKELLAPGQQNDEEDKPGKKQKTARINITRVKRCIDSLNLEYSSSGRAFRIIEVSGGFAFQTTKEFGAWVGLLFAERSRRRLTQSALETLSIVAFKQPISKPAIEAIRGVNAEYVIKSLLERNLISIIGRDDTPGRPLLYGTTKSFLKHFGLSSINDLPKPREIEELLASHDDFVGHPIEEIDPSQAMAMTAMSSQELERMFDTARIRSAASEEGDTEEPQEGDQRTVTGLTVTLDVEQLTDTAVAADDTTSDTETDSQTEHGIDANAEENEIPNFSNGEHSDDIDEQNEYSDDSNDIARDESSHPATNENHSEDMLSATTNAESTSSADFSSTTTPEDDTALSDFDVDTVVENGEQWNEDFSDTSGLSAETDFSEAVERALQSGFVQDAEDDIHDNDLTPEFEAELTDDPDVLSAYINDTDETMDEGDDYIDDNPFDLEQPAESEDVSNNE